MQDGISCLPQQFQIHPGPLVPSHWCLLAGWPQVGAGGWWGNVWQEAELFNLTIEMPDCFLKWFVSSLPIS